MEMEWYANMKITNLEGDNAYDESGQLTSKQHSRYRL